jgi:hypothetical protein
LRRVAAVYGGSAPHHRTLHEPKYRKWLADVIYLLDLPDTDLDAYDALVIPERLHQGRLAEASEAVLGLLDRGGTVVAFGGGEHPPGWLPGLHFEHQPTNFWWWREPGATLGLVATAPEHSLFRHLTMADVTWHHHGVLHPPDGAETVIGLEGRDGAILYVDRVSTAGTLVTATLDPISHFGSYFMPASERFLEGFLPWLATDAL